MNVDERLQLLRDSSLEIIEEQELRALLEQEQQPIVYDGYEPSGQLHIAQGILVPHILNTFITCGFHVKFFLADWHAQANNKMGGDLQKIQNVGTYMKEVLLASGLNPKVEWVWASDLQKSPTYWQRVLQTSMANSVKRIERCAEIMGRAEGSLQSSQILYPLMQCVDIFELKADCIAMGMDQRKVNMLAREVAPKLNLKKPVAVHHRMLMGLTEPQTDKTGVEGAIAKKMSKSNPNSAVFMTDPTEVVLKKFKKAYCPEKQVENNPVLEYAKYIVFAKFDSVDVTRDERFGGNKTFSSYDEVEADFVSGALHPADLKSVVGTYINKMLDPVRDHFAQNEDAKKLLETVQSYQVTR
ncbi:MAG: tyrosyl-tRNA synthetase [Candidatus Woesearchaeota archaeon]|jgi:tyrosyl-tRNA synthetase